MLWDPDMSVYIANALSPAQVLSVDLNEENKTASVLVPERMLSLAIGKEGQNARLAAKLTGWRIDIKSALTEEFEEIDDDELARRAVELLRAKPQVTATWKVRTGTKARMLSRRCRSSSQAQRSRRKRKRT